MDTQAEALEQSFLGWQCRLRQIAMRRGEGRPSDGMQPRILLKEDGLKEDDRYSTAITVLINRQSAESDASRFRYLVQKTHDPADRFANGLKFLSATHYQRPHEFSDELTALFQPGGLLVRALLANRLCTLAFSQFSAAYTLPCTVRQLADDTPAYQATYWHNRLFNSRMPEDVIILGFKPDWNKASSTI